MSDRPAWTHYYTTVVCRVSLEVVDTGEQFKRRLKGWLFESAYGRMRV